jgi:hypothetical protein
MKLLNELLFHPTKEVKQGQPKGQSDRDVHDNNIGNSSDRKMIAVPTTARWYTHSNIHQFTGDVTGKKQCCAPYKYRVYCYSIFMYFAAVVALLVQETSQYYQQYLDFLDDGPSTLPDVTVSEMFLFLVIIILMEHNTQDNC